jgi:GR25 family glycosyltransferase involved in LPS biosynthesis
MEGILDGTFVINLDRDRDRLEEFDAMMAASNWNYERFPAVNGKRLMGDWNQIIDPEERQIFDQLIARKKRYVSNITWLTHGEIGCLLSHVLLWEEVANNPEKNRIAVFEDDARTHLDGNTVQKLLHDFYAYLDENDIPEPDMLYLGKSLDNCIDYEKIWGNVYRSKHPLCLHAYIITKQGAQKLINMAPYMIAVDVVPIKAIGSGLLDAMAFHPSLYFQDIFGTTSNLRQIKAGINNTTECLVFQQHITYDTWQFMAILIVGLIAALTLFIIFVWMRPWTMV